MTAFVEGPFLVPAVLLGVNLLMRAVVAAYYADADRMLRVLSLHPRPPAEPPRVYKRWDRWLAPLPFVWSWIEIVVAVQLAALAGHPAAWVAVTVWVGGRFRAIQEYGHNAVHYALCPDEKYRSGGRYPFQWWLADFFYQFPSLKGDMPSRFRTHKEQHHRNPNHEEKDPNRERVRAGGMVAPLTRWQFYRRLLYPVSPRGFVVTLGALWRGVRTHRNGWAVAGRVASMASVAAVLYTAGGWQGVVFGWLVPLVTTYPVFAWLALLAEHRWFVPESAAHPRDQEFVAGRPTDYSGLAGWLVRTFIAPTSDAYHLAHSLYPTVRWNYLPAIDRHLKVNDPRYTANASHGFLFPRDGVPAALSELRDRLTQGSAV